MRSSIISAGLLVSGAVAQPFGHGHGHGHGHGSRHVHQPRAAHAKRAVVTTWVVTTETVYEIIDEFTTFLSTPGVATTVTTSSSSTLSTLSTVSTLSNLSNSPTPSATSSSTTIYGAGDFFEGATYSAAVPLPPPAPTSLSTSTVPEQVPANTPAPAPAPASQSEMTTPAAPRPSPSLPVDGAPPAVTTTTLVSAEAGAASKYSGDLTYYDLGLGSCGWDDSGKGETQNIVAIAVGQMGAQSNGNSWCGKTVTLQRDGVTQQAVVRDKCMGCADGAIDGSRHLFKALFSGSLEEGRGTVTWWVNE